MKFLANALLLFATTATAGELCVNYVSNDGGKGAFTSFNPRSRENVVVAKMEFIPNYIVWKEDFGAVFYSGRYELEWKIGAVPNVLPRESTPGPPPLTSPTQQMGKLWTPNRWNADAPNPTFDAPANRMIDVGYGSCDTYEAYGAPVTWTDTKTGEKRTLTLRPPDTYNECSHPLQISTADNFILIAAKLSGTDAIVADMNTGEVLLRAGDQSEFAAWGKCPSK